MGWHEWPLIFFTVFAQTAVGAFIVMGLITLFGKADAHVKTAITRNMFFIWVFMGLGFMASTMHLGSPMRAINALNQIGTSWLSREILFGSMFFGLGGLYWLLSVINKGSESIRKGLMVAAMVIGVVFMVAMTNVYIIDTVPTWDTPFTGQSFTLTAVICGVMLSLILMRGAKLECPRLGKVTAIVASVAAVTMAMVTMSMVADLPNIHSAIVAASELVPNMAEIQNLRFVLVFVGLAAWMWAMRSESRSMPIAVIGFAMVLVAELIGRSVFFGLHMTAGM